MLSRTRLELAGTPPVEPAASTPRAVEHARRVLLDEPQPGAPRRAVGFEAVVVRTEQRPDSTIRIIRLGASDSRRHFYLKTLRATSVTHSLKRRAITTEYEILARLRARLAGLPHLTVVRPVACFAEELSLLTEEWPGRALDSVLGGVRGAWSRRRREQSARLCHLAGAWLRHFQAFTTPPEPRVFDLAELFVYCEERLKMSVDARASRVDARTATAVLRRLERVGNDVGREELTQVGRHNDFRPENMLTDGVRLALLDFTGFTYGPRLYDFMKFWLKLEDVGFSLVGHGRAVGDLQAAFREGYGPGVDPRSRLALLVRAAFVLDKISEAVDPDLPRAPLSRRAIMNHWYRRQRRWLLNFAQEELTT